MTRDELRGRLATILQHGPVYAEVRVEEVLLPVVDAYVEARLAAERERLAAAVEMHDRLRPEQFAWLHYPTYMRGIKEGMEFAAKFIRDGAPVDPRNARRAPADDSGLMAG